MTPSPCFVAASNIKVGIISLPKTIGILKYVRRKYVRLPHFTYSLPKVAVPELKHPVVMDITFGGMFYAIVNTDLVDELPKLVPENGKRIAYLGSKILVW